MTDREQLDPQLREAMLATASLMRHRKRYPGQGLELKTARAEVNRVRRLPEGNAAYYWDATAALGQLRRACRDMGCGNVLAHIPLLL